MTQTDDIYSRQSGFVSVDAVHEALHPEDAQAADYTVGETSYLGFSVPEAGISCEIYHWFHPVLGVASGGVLLWRGHHELTSQGEFIDYRNFLPLPDQIEAVEYPTGVRIEVIEPLAELRMTFASADGRFAFDVRSRAVMPPAGRLDNLHFAQAMHNTGTLTFEGAEYAVDSYFTRDRSWGRPRPEAGVDEPPLTWMGAAFGDDLAVHLVAHDGDDGLRWGYVWRDGELRAPAAVSKTTLRDGVWAVGSEIEVTDDRGDTLTLRGESVARLPMAFWPNMLTQLVLMRFELGDGRVTHGDYQDINFGNLNRALGRSGGA